MTDAVQWCGPCAVPPYNADENIWRADRFRMVIAKIGPDAPMIHRHGGTALEYVWLTNNQAYNLGITKGYNLKDAETRFQIAQYLRDFVDAREIDGILLDCPLDYPDMRAALDMVAVLKDAMPDKILMPNFGSLDAVTLTTKLGSFARWAAFSELLRETGWHFVQVALHTRDGWEKRFAECIDVVRREVQAGKRIVVGIDDRPESAVSSVGPHRPGLAAALAHALPRHENVFVAYQSNADPRGRMAWEYCWNPTLEALR